MNKIAAKIKEPGMYRFVRWNYIFVTPQLIVTKAQIDEGLVSISEAISIADEQVTPQELLFIDKKVNHVAKEVQSRVL